MPLIKKNLININNLTIDSKSGYSGAGKNLEKKFKHKNLYHSTFAYSTKHHRHISEIAKNNGINKTAQKTAKKLVALINSKGINQIMKKILLLGSLILFLTSCAASKQEK